MIWQSFPGGFGTKMRTLRITLVVLLAVASAQQNTRAQSLAIGLFERYLEPLRLQVGIPGLSAAIVQNGRIMWERHLGYADLERLIAVNERTAFPLVDLSQTLGATLLMQCVQRGYVLLDEPMNQWTSQVPESGATVRQVLTHTTTGRYDYNPSRFASLTSVIQSCTKEDYRLTVVSEILDFLPMRDSVPGHDLGQPSASVREMFSPADIARYQDVMRRVAIPYRVDGRGRATRSEFSPSRAIDAATGIITTVRDLAKFDTALDDGYLLRDDVIRSMRGGPVPGAPTGIGWFVQSYNGERLVWHFGSEPGAYSSLILKVPNRDLTLILLANSDGLSEPFALHRGDVTSSLFAKTFLRVFLP